MVALVPGLYGLGVRLSVTVKWDPHLTDNMGPTKGGKDGLAKCVSSDVCGTTAVIVARP